MKNIKLLVFGVLALAASTVSAQEVTINKATVSNHIEAMLADNLNEIKISVNPTVVNQVSLALASTAQSKPNEKPDANSQTEITATISE